MKEFTLAGRIFCHYTQLIESIHSPECLKCELKSVKRDSMKMKNYGNVRNSTKLLMFIGVGFTMHFVQRPSCTAMEEIYIDKSQ